MQIQQQCKTNHHQQLDYPISDQSYQHQGGLPSVDIESLRHEAKNFKILYDEFIGQQFFSCEYYYLISTKWFRRWKKYVSYEQSISAAPPVKYIGRGNMPKINQNIVKATSQFLTCFQGHLKLLNVALKQGLCEEKDYMFVNEQIWRFFSDKYDNIQVKRYVVNKVQGKKVQLYYQEVTFIPIFADFLKKIETEKVSKLHQLRLQISHYFKIIEVQNLIKDILINYLTDRHLISYSSIPQDVPMRLWLLKQDTRTNVLCNQLLQGCKANPSFTYKLICQGTFMQPQKQACDYDILDSSLIMVQLQQKNQQWMFYNSSKPYYGNCNNCKSKQQLTFSCSCKSVLYCSKKCKLQDKSSHRIRCPNSCQSDQQQGQLQFNQYSRKGLVGLRNLGNTCFMNSGLQCLSHVMELTKYFLEDKYLKEINKNNPLGTGGELSIAYGKMLKNLWMGSETSFSPTQLKRAIGKFQPMFMGYNQHDSGQLVSFLLDGLHQDLNRIIQKPYVQSKDYDGRPDFIIAKQAWQNHLKRNKSIIVDLMFGQFKSIVDCPVCKYQSIQFDPFLMCTLPLVNDNIKNIQVIFLKDHLNLIKQKITYDVNSNYTIKDMFKELKKRFNFNDNVVLLAYISSDNTCEAVDEMAKVNQIRKEKLSYKKLVVREKLPQENLDTDVPVAVSHVYCNSVYGNQSYRRTIAPYNLWYMKRQASCKQVHDFIYSKYKQLYPVQDYFSQVINIQPKQQPFRLLTVQQWRYNSKCQYCGQKGCDGCVLPYDQNKKISDYVSDQKSKIDIQFFWRKNSQKIKEKFQQVIEKLQKQDEKNKKNGTTIDQCFKLFEEPEILAQDNAWYCPKCKDFVLAKKQMQIYKAPKILIVCLKRFKRKQYFNQKHNILVDFPMTGLDISKYVMNHNLPEDYFKGQTNQNNKKDQLLYDLVGITNHFGGTGGGHYTAYCMDPETGKWYDFDDSYVSELKCAEDAIAPSAYMLYYKRREA